MSLIQAWRVQEDAPKALTMNNIEVLQQEFPETEVKETPKGTFLFVTNENVADDLARWMARHVPNTPMRLTSVDRL